MSQTQEKALGWLNITQSEFREIIRPEKDPEASVKRVLYIIGILFSFLSVVGALRGYKRAYNRFVRKDEIPPFLAPLLPTIRAAMIIGAVAFPLIFIMSVFLLILLFSILFNSWTLISIAPAIIAWILVNLVFSFFSMISFERWRAEVFNSLLENQRFGTARFAKDEEIADLASANHGFYIGGHIYKYEKQGHLLTVAGTRGGKGTNIIIPNLLGLGRYEGSWVVIDIKGEITPITVRYQRESGQNVLVLDPWSLRTKPGEGAMYNPLDLVVGGNAEHLSDDADVIAQMIIPENPKDKDPYFANRARSILSGLLMHLSLSEEIKEKTLTKIWEWTRLPEDDWATLIGDMAVSDNAIIKGVANQIFGIKSTSEKTYGTIISVLQDHTDFLKSPALQKSLAQSNFNINNISDGKTTLYVIIPADKVESHSKWLRLVVTTALRAVIRNKNKRVTFLLDEFANSLGYLPEIKTAMGAYAGYNVTIWSILQNLGQLKALYGENWETFLGNTAVKHFFNTDDMFTIDYLSKLLGETTFITYDKTVTGKSEPKTTSRRLVTPDEVRRGSASNIFTFVEQRPPTYFAKLPYYEMPQLQDRYDANPYYTPSNNNASQ